MASPGHFGLVLKSMLRKHWYFECIFGCYPATNFFMHAALWQDYSRIHLPKRKIVFGGILINEKQTYVFIIRREFFVIGIELISACVNVSVLCLKLYLMFRQGIVKVIKKVKKFQYPGYRYFGLLKRV